MTVSQQDLEDGFRSIGLKKGMYVEVHSSLSSFGHVEGGAPAVIAALKNVVTPGGAIIMTAFPFSRRLEPDEQDLKMNISVKMRILDPASEERTDMGLIADTFKRDPEVVLGTDQWPVAAWGAEAELNAKGLSNLHQKDGYALLLGVDICRLTSMHYVEGELPEEVKALTRPSDEVRRKYPESEWYVETGTPPSYAWYAIQDEAFRMGYFAGKTIGNSRCLFCKLNEVIGLYRHALETDPLGLYRLR